MAWIESHQSLAQHPKTKRLTRRLGTHKMQTIGHLQALWWWATDYAEDGYLDRYEDEDIADAVEWEGDASLFAQALVDSGFVDVDEDGRRRIHDWDQYIGRLVARREADRERKRKAMTKDSAGTPQESDGTLRDSKCNQPTNQPTVTNQPVGNRSMPLDAPSAKHVTKDFLERMRQEYPSLDVDHQWERASNHKAYKNAIDKCRYFQTWLRKEVGYQAERVPSPNGKTGVEIELPEWMNHDDS